MSEVKELSRGGLRRGGPGGFFGKFSEKGLHIFQSSNFSELSVFHPKTKVVSKKKKKKKRSSLFSEFLILRLSYSFSDLYYLFPKFTSNLHGFENSHSDGTDFPKLPELGGPSFRGGPLFSRGARGL